MKIVHIFILIIISSAYPFTKKEYSGYDQTGARYFLNGLFYEQVGSSDRAEENFQVAFLRTNSDVIKLNLSVSNLISGNKEEGYKMLRDLYEKGFNLGRFGIYLYLSLEPGKAEADSMLDRIISDLNGIGEINTASSVVRQRMTDSMYSFLETDDFVRFFNDLYPSGLNANYEYFFKSVMFQVQSRLKQDAEEMEKIIVELENKHGEIPYAFYSMAFSEYLKMDEFDRAGEILKKMHRYNYGEAGYYYFNAEFYAKKAEFEKARNTFIEGIKKFPDSSLSLGLASLYLSRNDFTNAGIIYDKVIASGPDSDYIYELISNEYSKAGNDGVTFDFYEKALKKFPDDPEILNNYAYLLAVRGSDLKKALSMINKALSFSSNSITFLDTKAWVLFRMGQSEEAEKIMDGIFSEENSYFHQSSEELLEHYSEIKKSLNKAGATENISINRTAVVLSEIFANSSYLLETGF
jgi:tetratricopeptide (TPR) repeat protein